MLDRTLAVIPFDLNPATKMLSTDQRGMGFQRKYDYPGGSAGEIVDIGAYEIQVLKVIDVIVSRSTANPLLHPPYSFATATFNGQPVVGNGNQLRTVPVGGADKVAVRFSEEIDLDTLNEASLTFIPLAFVRRRSRR